MKKFWILSSIVVIVALAGCKTQIEQKHTVTIKGHELTVQLVNTPQARQKGLGGVAELSDTEGMLFIFPDKAVRTFWMKDMLIPIDIIWVNETTVVGFEMFVQPLLTQAQAGPVLYSSSNPVNHVLEVRAGFVEEYDIQVGDEVILNIS